MASIRYRGRVHLMEQANQFKSKFLRFIVDTDGTLDPTYANVVFGAMKVGEFMDKYDDGANKFSSTTYTLIYNFAQEYHKIYQKPPTEDAISSELLTSSHLNMFEKEAVRKVLNEIREFKPVDNEFNYVVDRIRDEYITSQTIRSLKNTVEMLKENPTNAIQYVQEQMSKLSTHLSVDLSVQDKTLFLHQFADMLKEEIVEKGELMSGAIPYPYPMFNDVLGGMHQGELIVIAGPSGLGKSFIGHDIAFHVGVDLGMPVVCADKEMLHKQNGVRFLARQTRLPARKLRSKDLRTPIEEELLLETLNQLSSLEENMFLFIPPHKATNVPQIKAEIQAHYGKEKPKLIVVDYLSDLESTNSNKSEGWEAIKAIAHELKNLALYYECPVVTMAQMNSAGKDIQYGGIKHVADTLLILSEDENNKYVPPAPNEFIGTPGIINVFTAKARNDSKNVNMPLEIEYSTASIRQAPAFGSTSIRKSVISRQAEGERED